MRVALDTDRVSLIHGETLATLRSFADKSFDLVLTDPPYHEHVHANLGKERRNDGGTPREALAFPPMTADRMREVMSELVRVSRGWIIIFSDFYNSYLWGNYARSVGGSWVRTGTWVKTTPMPQMTGDRPAVDHEDIVICHAEAKGFEWNGHGHASLWRGPREHGAEHPNQKPLWLIQQLLGMFAPAGGLCLDPYIGAGTTAVAALLTERAPGEVAVETTCKACAKKITEQYAPPLPERVNVIGVEGDPQWLKVAISRIRTAAPTLSAA